MTIVKACASTYNKADGTRERSRHSKAAKKYAATVLLLPTR